MGPESAQYRNGHFYGIRYLDYGSECSRQPILPHIPPVLVEAVTDADGKITEMTEYPPEAG